MYICDMNIEEAHQVSGSSLIELLCQDSIPGRAICHDRELSRFHGVPVELMPRLFLIYAVYYQMEFYPNTELYLYTGKIVVIRNDKIVPNNDSVFPYYIPIL